MYGIMWPELWNLEIFFGILIWVLFSVVWWGCNLHRASPYNSQPLLPRTPLYFGLWTNIASQIRDHVLRSVDDGAFNWIEKFEPNTGVGPRLRRALVSFFSFRSTRSTFFVNPSSIRCSAGWKLPDTLESGCQRGAGEGATAHWILGWRYFY